jgi:hypothetical protein
MAQIAEFPANPSMKKSDALPKMTVVINPFSAYSAGRFRTTVRGQNHLKHGRQWISVII